MGSFQSKDSKAKELGIRLGKAFIEKDEMEEKGYESTEIRNKVEEIAKEIGKEIRELLNSIQEEKKLDRNEKRDKKTNMKIIIATEAYRYLINYFKIKIKSKDVNKFIKTRDEWNSSLEGLFRMNSNYTNSRDDKDNAWIKNYREDLYNKL